MLVQKILRTLQYHCQHLDLKQIAVLAKKVENDYIGVSGGIMDQMVSSIGINGKAFFLNCTSFNYEKNIWKIY